ncbi:MAG: steroid 5-alpha reductase family enzyme [Roseivirga sp.]|jgi:steroid 5-alpha reductase family enzyme
MAGVMMDLIVEILGLGLLYACFWFILSIIFKRNDIADIAWGLGYILLCAYLFWTQAVTDLSILMYDLVALWGLRLSLHIGIRNSKKPEDFRYNNWRKEWGKAFYLRSFLQVYLLQVVILLVVSTPLIIVSQFGSNIINGYSITLTIFWLIGFIWQALADYQLAQFKKHRTDKDQVLQTGLWKYSRHPNYFGEILMWWSIGLIAVPLEWGWIGLISPLLISYLLLNVSGVPMLEKRYEGNLAFESYKKKTPAVFPKFKFKD